MAYGVAINTFSLLSICITCCLDYKEDMKEEKDFYYSESQENEIFKISYLKKLNASFYLICAINVFIFSALYSFKYSSGGFFTNYFISELHDYNKSLQFAGLYMTIPFIIAMILIPVLGYVIDKLGYPEIFLFISSIFYAIGYCWFFYYLSIGLVFLGVALSISSVSLWSLISSSVKPNKIVRLNIYFN